MIRAPLFLLGSLFCIGCAATASAQPFQIVVRQEDSLASVANGSSVGIATSDIGQPLRVTISVIYRGNTVATIGQAPTLIGSPSFVIVRSDGVPAVLSPGSTYSFDVTFIPQTSASVNVLAGLTYQEAPPPGAAQGTQPSNGFIVLNLVGQAPEFVISYVFASNGNVIALPPDSKLTFPPTPINTNSLVTISIVNRGSGPGVIRSVSVTGSAFEPLGLPLTPGSVPAGQDLRFSIRYSPTTIETSTGLLTVNFQNRVVKINLEGSSTRSNLVYQTVGPQGSNIVTPSQTISLPDTPVGETSSISVQVQNTGDSNGVINLINLTGSGFQVSNLPTLPKTLTPNEITVFTLSFSPTQAGESTGRLLIGNDSFPISAIAVGVRLIYSYTTGSATTILPPANGSVFFSAVAAGQSAKTTLSVRNAGTSPAAISNIGVVEPKSPFTVSDLPALPVTISPGGAMQFTVAFKPTAPGFVNGTLRLDGQTFQLSGSGSIAPPLPGVSFTGASGGVAPLQQPAIGLTLAAPYSQPINGVLTLSLNAAAFGADPSVQFATGGKTASFTIPANTTQAIFSNNSPQIRVQSGTVAGTISIKPTFAIGDFDITPDSTPTLTFTVQPSAPQLFDLQVVSTSATSLLLVIPGIVTSRSLTKMDFTFTPAPGFHANVTQFSVDVSALALGWFNSSASQPFGSQFTISVPFSLQTGSSSTTALDVIQSISVTATNELGASKAVTVNLR